MSTSYSTEGRLAHPNRSSIKISDNDHSDEDSRVSTASSESDEALEIDSEEAKTAESSATNPMAKPDCPRPVHQIINALSVAGTMGGLALIITGGMGMTLNNPDSNPMHNGAMLLSGGALLSASFLGGSYHLSRQAAEQ